MSDEQPLERIADVLDEGIKVTLDRTPSAPSDDQGLWVAIRNRTNATSFKQYQVFITKVLCEKTWANYGGTSTGKYENETKYGSPNIETLRENLENRTTIHSVDAYNLLRLATEVFLLLKCGLVKFEDGSTKPKLINMSKELSDLRKEGVRFGLGKLNEKELNEKELNEKELNEKELNEKEKQDLIGKIEERLSAYFKDSAMKLPYLSLILKAIFSISEDDKADENKNKLQEGMPYCNYVLQHRASCPSMIELIWSYWHEEAMQVQSMNAISLRFQNRRGSADNDPLANLEIDSLRPLNNLLWGYIQNEQNRLTVPRRAYEYDHHYGLTLYGKAVPQLRSADSRSKFLEGFHSLLHQTLKFYQQDANTTVVAEGFPLLNALKEVHILLSEGAHNQFGDLPWTARVEMLIEQWLLARPEMKEFLRGRYMVPYPEDWMGTVDTMKKSQGWSDVTVTHFNELARFGEQILLSVRYGDWINVSEEDWAKNWARYWKPEIQSYIHSYRAVTGVDLSTEPVDSTPPWVHLKRQEDARKRAARA